MKEAPTLLSSILVLLSVSACGLEQSAYRQVYEEAKQREVAAQQKEPVMTPPVNVVVAREPAVDIQLCREHLETVRGEDANMLKTYNVVVSSFQNHTNAYSFEERLQAQGYNPVLDQNEADILRVVITDFDSHREAEVSREQVKGRFVPDFRDAWILEKIRQSSLPTQPHTIKQESQSLHRQALKLLLRTLQTIEIIQQQPLREYHTFITEVTADWWINYNSAEDLQTLARDEYFVSQSYLPIGAGSSLPSTYDKYRDVILYSQINDPRYYGETESALTRPGQQHIRAGSGIVWGHFVELILSRGLYEVENLSLIPGAVGAATIQNIGAYGSEVSQYIVVVDVVDLVTGMTLHIPSALCNCGYEYNIFKDPRYHSYITTHVHFILSTEPIRNLSYTSLAKAFEGRDAIPTPEEICREMIRIRRAKLPDPEEIPNGGSFFMNPIVPLARYEKLAEQYDTPVSHYPTHHEGEVKLSAAQLIDQMGLRGYRTGAVGVYEKQPLVLVNYGGATGQEAVALTERVQQEVSHKFGITLHPEVRCIG